jgi:hypothetical protein
MAKSAGVLELSRKQAEKYAFRLMAYSSAIFPEKNKKIGNIIAQDIIETGINFAVNARRTLDYLGGNLEINEKRWDYDLDSKCNLEKSVRNALNGIIHAHDLKVHSVIAPHGVFKDNENTIFLHFTYETDRFPETYVDIFGLAWSYVSASETSNSLAGN